MRRKALVIVLVVSAFTALAAADGPYSVVKEITISDSGSPATAATTPRRSSI